MSFNAVSNNRRKILKKTKVFISPLSIFPPRSRVQIAISICVSVNIIYLHAPYAGGVGDGGSVLPNTIKYKTSKHYSILFQILITFVILKVVPLLLYKNAGLYFSLFAGK